MCVWKEIYKTNECKGCPLYDKPIIDECGYLEDVQDIVDIIGLLENMIDRLDKEVVK